MSMRRSGLAGALGAAVLTLSWVSAPAAPAAPPATVSPEVAASILAMAPLAEEVAQDTERLRARLQITADPAAPKRDPFSFGRTPAEPRVPPPAPQTDERPAAPTPVVAGPAPIVWPTLAAVLTDTNASRTAVLASGDSLEFLALGATWRDFLVLRLDADSVDLRHVPTNTLTTLRLR